MIKLLKLARKIRDKILDRILGEELSNFGKF